MVSLLIIQTKQNLKMKLVSSMLIILMASKKPVKQNQILVIQKKPITKVPSCNLVQIVNGSPERFIMTI